MKRLTVILGLLVACSASAESGTKDETLETFTAKRARENPPEVELTKPNEITVGRLTYGGIAVQVVKTDNPLQLVSPFAPERYGQAEDNVVRDPISNHISGLKIFSIQF